MGYRNLEEQSAKVDAGEGREQELDMMANGVCGTLHKGNLHLGSCGGQLPILICQYSVIAISCGATNILRQMCRHLRNLEACRCPLDHVWEA